jgi:hypothetical protein
MKIKKTLIGIITAAGSTAVALLAAGQSTNVPYGDIFSSPYIQPIVGVQTEFLSDKTHLNYDLEGFGGIEETIGANNTPTDIYLRITDVNGILIKLDDKDFNLLYTARKSVRGKDIYFAWDNSKLIPEPKHGEMYTVEIFKGLPVPMSIRDLESIAKAEFRVVSFDYQAPNRLNPEGVGLKVDADEDEVEISSTRRNRLKENYTFDVRVYNPDALDDEKILLEGENIPFGSNSSFTLQDRPDPSYVVHLNIRPGLNDARPILLTTVYERKN